MARHFVRLKLALLAGSFKLDWQQAAGFVLSAVVGVPVGMAGFALLVWLGGDAAGGTGLRLVFALLVVVWTVGPPLLFGLDETLDPARLRPLPLSRRQLAVGLLAASSVGVGPAVTALVVAGAVVGFAPAGPAALLVLAAACAHFLLCLVTARTVTTLLSGWLRSRRGRDVVVVVGAIGALGLVASLQLPGLMPAVVGGDEALSTAFASFDERLGTTPPAWAASAILAASDGRTLEAAGWLAATVGLVVAATAVWMWLLDRVGTTPPPARAGTDAGLFSGVAAVLPRTRLGAAAAREIRYQWRVPQLRTQLLTVAGTGAAFVVAAFALPGEVPPTIVLGAAGLAGLGALGSVNAFGADRGAVWALVAAGGIGRADLAGKNLAGVVLALPTVSGVAVGLAAASGGWAYVPATLAASLAVVCCIYGVGDVVSVLTPMPLPDTTGNVWATASGSGCAAAFAQVLAMAAAGLLILPAAAAVAFTAVFASGWLPLVAVAAVGYGIGVWWLGLVFAARLALGRGPEIVGALRRGA